MSTLHQCRICKGEADPDSCDPLCQPCADAWMADDEAYPSTKSDRAQDAKDGVS